MGVLAIRDFDCSAVYPSGYLRASYHVHKIGCLLVRDIPLPAAQLFVIAIQNILLGVCGHFNEMGTAGWIGSATSVVGTGAR